MTTQFSVAEAKAKLSELLDRALSGEEIVIARGGRRLVRLAPMDDRPPRKPGAWRGWHASPEVLLATMDDADLDAAEGKYSDEFGLSQPAAKPR